MATTADIFKDMQLVMREYMNGLAAYVPAECRPTLRINQYDSLDLWNEGYELSFDLGNEEFVDAKLLVIDAYEFGGEGEPNKAVNISLEITGPDGEVLVHAVPFNFTPKVWVSTRNAEKCVNELKSRLEFILRDDISTFGLRLSTGTMD